MPKKSTEQRNFDQMLTAQLSDDAREAVNAAFEAMSTWRNEIVNSEKNSEQVIEKMAEAARELGWPEPIKSPNSSSTMLSKLTSLPNLGPIGSWPNADNPQMAALNPFQFYMQVAQQWQKTWADAMASWAKANTSSRA